MWDSPVAPCRAGKGSGRPRRAPCPPPSPRCPPTGAVAPRPCLPRAHGPIHSSTHWATFCASCLGLSMEHREEGLGGKALQAAVRLICIRKPTSWAGELQETLLAQRGAGGSEGRLPEDGTCAEACKPTGLARHLARRQAVQGGWKQQPGQGSQVGGRCIGPEPTVWREAARGLLI